MKRLVLTVLACGALVLPAAIFAAPSDKGACRQGVHAALVALSEEGTVGDYVSDGFYGNEPNPEPPNPGGGTEPSQSPGPKVTNPDGSVSPGNSWGFYESGVIKDACNG
jgi:hypothetical protein